MHLPAFHMSHGSWMAPMLLPASPLFHSDVLWILWPAAGGGRLGTRAIVTHFLQPSGSSSVFPVHTTVPAKSAGSSCPFSMVQAFT